MHHAQTPLLLAGSSLVLIWLLLTDLSAGSWLLGVPAVAAALWVVHRLRREGNLPSLAGLLRFVPFFLRESLRGGLDVAGRILRPQMPLNPGFHRYPLRLKEPAARLLFLNSVSLLPGTLSADLDGDEVQIHALDISSDIDTELRALEAISARVYREAL